MSKHANAKDKQSVSVITSLDVLQNADLGNSFWRHLIVTNTIRVLGHSVSVQIHIQLIQVTSVLTDTTDMTKASRMKCDNLVVVPVLTYVSSGTNGIFCDKLRRNSPLPVNLPDDAQNVNSQNIR